MKNKFLIHMVCLINILFWMVSVAASQETSKNTSNDPGWIIFSLLGIILVLALFVYRLSQSQAQMKEKLSELEKEASAPVNHFHEELLARIAHELKSPLHGITALAESLIDGVTGKLVPPTVENLNIIASSSKRLSFLVNDILDYSQIRIKEIELTKRPLDLRSTLEGVLILLKPMAGKKPISFHNRIPADLPLVDVDENRIQQILINLVGNAVKFTKSGKISVVASIQDEQFVAVTVSDTGVGISPENVEKIFRPFEQGNGTVSKSKEYGGTGLGLAITRELVRAHGGDVSVESELGKGSHFIFTIPVSNESRSSDPSIQAVDSLSNNAADQSVPIEDTQNVVSHAVVEEDLNFAEMLDLSAPHDEFQILIVDDDQINLQVLSNYLHLQKFTVTQAINGEDCLAMVQNNQPDLILLDVMMPKISGFEVCKKIRKQYPLCDLPIIMLTAKNKVSDLMEGFAAGANDYLPKPFSKQELMSRIRTHLKLLALNRSLEQKVTERTSKLNDTLVQLESQHQQLKEAQVHLVQSEKMASLGMMIAGIAHEINNPTSYVFSGAQNIERLLQNLQEIILQIAKEGEREAVAELFNPKFSKIFQNLEAILDGSKRINGIVSDLATFGRKDSENTIKSDILKGLELSIKLVKTQYKDHVEFICDFAEIPYIECLPSQINQVFINLMINACQAIRACQKQSDEKKMGLLKISAKVQDRYIEVRFQDNGCGMPKDVQQKIFEPFFTTKEIGEGTGIGLSVVFGIVERHQGNIHVESSVGKGTTFTVSLPI
ncbi:MAG: response regulator [SAR324 cluster bacterium]|nr:response regulator [SAR324 cluster bacterium]